MAKYHEVNDKILLELSRSRIAMIVEGISSQEYPSYLKGFETDLQRFGEPCLLDFLEEISEDPNNLSDKISGKELLLVYNLDLFGRDVDPKKATQGMEIL